MKIEWARYIENGNIEEVYYQQLDDTLYKSQYIGHLYCITDGCEAEMKFTERKDGLKFFSTMNGQGTKHLNICPNYVNYEGETPRRKLNGVPVDSSVSDDWILQTLLNKSRDLKNKNKPRPKINKPGSTKKIVDGGEGTVVVPVPGGAEGSGQSAGNVRFGSINSDFITKEFLGDRKRVVGIAKHALFVDNEDSEYGYIQLQNDALQVNAYFPPAFYADTRVTTKPALISFIELINREINKGREILILCFGLLEADIRGNGININILNYKHILANENQYYKIITSGNISDNPYPA
ncbi:hypothetical protein AB1I68_05140 [Paenibacillus pabuli]|uniref:hypothetical protein n=1 Tax=Paenibacillus pabuli TaxID=1472 RepID=UPI003457FB08